MTTYKIIDIVGTSEKNFADAAKNAVIEAAKTVRKIRRAEVTKLDVKVQESSQSESQPKIETKTQTSEKKEQTK